MPNQEAHKKKKWREGRSDVSVLAPSGPRADKGFWTGFVVVLLALFAGFSFFSTFLSKDSDDETVYTALAAKIQAPCSARLFIFSAPS